MCSVSHLDWVSLRCHWVRVLGLFNGPSRDRGVKSLDVHEIMHACSEAEVGEKEISESSGH